MIRTGSYATCVAQNECPHLPHLPTISNTWDNPPGNYLSRFVVSVVSTSFAILQFVLWGPERGAGACRREPAGGTLPAGPCGHDRRRNDDMQENPIDARKKLFSTAATLSRPPLRTRTNPRVPSAGALCSAFRPEAARRGTKRQRQSAPFLDPGRVPLQPSNSVTRARSSPNSSTCP